MDEVLDVAGPGVIGVMARVTLRRRAGKRERGEAVCASLQSRHPVSAAALPVTNISVDGAICLALVDSGMLTLHRSRAVLRIVDEEKCRRNDRERSKATL